MYLLHVLYVLLEAMPVVGCYSNGILSQLQLTLVDTVCDVCLSSRPDHARSVTSHPLCALRAMISLLAAV